MISRTRGWYAFFVKRSTTKLYTLSSYRSERMLAEQVAERLGLRPELCGSAYLVDAATLYAYTDLSMPEIYEIGAAHHGITANGVHKNAAYAVSRSVKLSHSFSIVFDIPFGESLHPNAAVAYLARAIKHPELVRRAIYDKEFD